MSIKDMCRLLDKRLAKRIDYEFMLDHTLGYDFGYGIPLISLCSLENYLFKFSIYLH